jgi:methionyl-tRNA formyltransferase
MGTPDFAVEPLRAIIAAGHRVVAVVTQPDRGRGRGRNITMSAVKEDALRYGIPVLQPQKIKSCEEMAELQDYLNMADIGVVAAYGQILPSEILDLPRYGFINIHASLLPLYRGAAPMQQAIIDGVKESGITIMQMDSGIDTGDILLQRAIPLAADESGDSLETKLSLLGAELVTEALTGIEEGLLTPRKQDDSLSSYAPMLSADRGKIDWGKQAKELERLVRGLYSRPGAYTYYNGKKMKITKSLECFSENQAALLPGTIAAVSPEGILVICGSGNLRITRLQIEGKKEMTAAEHLCGNKMTVGEKLG